MFELLLLVAANVLLVLLVVLTVRQARDRRQDAAARDTLRARIDADGDRLERVLREELRGSRGETGDVLRNLREEVVSALKGSGDSLLLNLESVARRNDGKLEAIRGSVEEKLGAMQAQNATKLDEMRATVDEKLQGTLEKRLGESFAQVSERLERVHQGLGEMQSLATGVGDLKKMLSNVKTRGTWGETQLGALLDEMMTPDQFAKNVATRPGTAERVEFALRMPGRDEGDASVWLPIDAKFPQEDYQRLVDASERGDAEGVETAAKALENRIKASAKDISTKYLEPPFTTEFAILYLPVEGLFAEIVRRPALVDAIRREWRVVIAGPTTLSALLSSLQMGFRTLAIQKRSSEVWSVLGSVKTEFGKFGAILDGVKKKLEQASKTIDEAATKTRTIERRLRDVQAVPSLPEHEEEDADSARA